MRKKLLFDGTDTRLYGYSRWMVVDQTLKTSKIPFTKITTMSKVDYLVQYLTNNGFRLIDQSTPPQPFGNFYYTFSNGMILVEVSRDRSFDAVDVFRADDKDEKFDLLEIKKLLQYDDNFIQVDNFEVLVDYFVENIDEIMQLFNNDQYIETKKCLNELQRCKVNQMFPEDRRYACPFDAHACLHPCPSGIQGPKPPVRVSLKTTLEMLRFEIETARITNFYAPFKAIYEQLLEDISKSEIVLDNLSESEIKEIKSYEYVLDN